MAKASKRNSRTLSTAAKLKELGFAAPQVVAHRLTRMFWPAPSSVLAIARNSPAWSERSKPLSRRRGSACSRKECDCSSRWFCRCLPALRHRSTLLGPKARPHGWQAPDSHLFIARQWPTPSGLRARSCAEAATIARRPSGGTGASPWLVAGRLVDLLSTEVPLRDRRSHARPETTKAGKQ